jgi:drug/metabolite transporter (DMT)-like permease
MSALAGRRLAMYIALCAVWGSTWLVIKVGLRDLPPLWFGGIRMALACALITPFALAKTDRTQIRGTTRPLVWAGLFQIGVNYACIFVGEQWIESGLTAVLFATFPLWAGLFAHFMLPDEPLTRRVAVSAVLGLIGVAIIEAPSLLRLASGATGMRAAGSGLVLLAAFVAAYSNVYVKKYLASVPAVWTTWLQLLSGSSLLLALAAVFEPHATLRWTSSSIGALLYLSILGTALPFAGLFWLLHRVPMSVIGTIPVIDTVIAVALGNLILGESFAPRVLAGAALILVAVLLASRRSPGQSLPGRKKNEIAAIR